MAETPLPFTAQHPLQDNYRLLRIYAWYRAFLACVLIGMFAANPDSPQFLGKIYPPLYGYTASLYMVMNFVTLLRLLVTHQTPTTWRISAICLIDIIALTLIMHSSGGVSTGLGLFVFIAVAAGSIFLQGQLATLLAALACIAILVESLFTAYGQRAEGNPVAAALLGVLLFITSQLFQYLTRRIRDTQQTAELQSAHAETLQELNQTIVQRMHTGIAVLDGNSNVVLYNEAAARLLSWPLKSDPRDQLSFLSNPVLRSCLAHWQANPFQRPAPIQLEEGSPELQLNFARLERNPARTWRTQDYLLVFVEDTRQISQRAQQLKLASLGHLTASIAHEVRNPLGAISHAAQLLGESDALPEADRRLASIIQTHSLRVNRIIENVLQLSRRSPPAPERKDLCEWLVRFAQQYQQTHSEPVEMELRLPQEPLYVYADFSQLDQVLGNLCNNGLRHSLKKTGHPRITLHAYYHHSLDTPCLDIIDYGEGISDKDREQIFEPFFTTEQQGTGLGLYIARELCLANQASLDYKHNHDGLSCFQISFAHTNKIP